MHLSIHLSMYLGKLWARPACFADYFDAAGEPPAQVREPAKCQLDTPRRALRRLLILAPGRLMAPPDHLRCISTDPRGGTGAGGALRS